jgi:hypothetical protein
LQDQNVAENNDPGCEAGDQPDALEARRAVENRLGIGIGPLPILEIGLVTEILSRSLNRWH